MKQPRWQRRLVGVCAAVVGLILCGLMGLLAWQEFKDGITLDDLAKAEVITAGIFSTVGLGMIAIGIYDGFVSETDPIGWRHNRFLYVTTWIGILTFAGFLGLVVIRVLFR